MLETVERKADIMSAVGSSSTRRVLIRHGESHSVADGWISGKATCRGLTERGVAQARVLRRRLAEETDLHPDVVLSSTMRRAVETADIIAEAVAVPVQALEELCERSPGECEGMSHDDYRATYGHEPWSDWIRPPPP